MAGNGRTSREELALGSFDYWLSQKDSASVERVFSFCGEATKEK